MVFAVQLQEMPGPKMEAACLLKLMSGTQRAPFLPMDTFWRQVRQRRLFLHY